jgi:hypothetical protein
MPFGSYYKDFVVFCSFLLRNHKTVAHDVRLYLFQNSFKPIIDKSSYSSIVSNLGSWNNDPTVTYTADISPLQFPLFHLLLLEEGSRGVGSGNVVFSSVLKSFRHLTRFEKGYCDSEFSLMQSPTLLNCWCHCGCSTLPLLLEIPTYTYLLITNYHICLHRICLTPSSHTKHTVSSFLHCFTFDAFHLIRIREPHFWVNMTFKLWRNCAEVL